MKHVFSLASKSWFSALFLVCIAPLPHSAVYGDAPLGWIHIDNPSAYTLERNQLQLSLGAITVNDSIDFLNVRDDLLSGTNRLIGDSGDLSGNTFEVHYGLLKGLSVFYKRQAHDLTVELGSFNSVDVVDLDTKLATTAETAGIKWRFYEGGLLNADGGRSAASIELHGLRSESDDFDLSISGFRLGGAAINFASPQTFSVAALEDDGWKLKLAYSMPLFRDSTASFTSGVSKVNATSATTSDLALPSLKSLFEQQFEAEDTIFSFGASFSTLIRGRLPLNVSYEYLRLSDSKFRRTPAVAQSGIPSFLSANPISETTNHTLSARLSYWITPEFSISLSGKFFSNQFVGILPHYNNSLSGSFSDTPYGFAGVEIGYKFR